MKKNNTQNSSKVSLNYVIIIGVSIIIIYGFVTRHNKLKRYSITQCSICGFGYASGGSGGRPEVAKYIFEVGGVKYQSDSSFPHDNSVKVGNCYKIKYSIEDPRVNEVLFDDGVVNCDK
jgi:hypothetical protein